MDEFEFEFDAIRQFLFLAIDVFKANKMTFYFGSNVVEYAVLTKWLCMNYRTKF